MLSLKHTPSGRIMRMLPIVFIAFTCLGCNIEWKKNQPPYGMINQPSQTKLRFGKNEPVKFAAYCQDPEDGLLDPDAIMWKSNIDGLLGTGNSFIKKNLSVGIHTITVSMTDSKGAVAEETLNIEIIGS